MIDKYLQNTHAATHNQYKMKILDVFDMAKHGEDSKFVDHGNRCVVEFVWFDSLHPSRQFFSYVGMGLPELNQY